MPPLNQAEKDAISASILQGLSGTRYACSSLKLLPGGTANFVYRGMLAEPFADQDEASDKSVIIKHTTDFASINSDLALDVTRCTFEESMLDAVAGFSPPANPNAVVKTPRLYLFHRETKTQVMEDFPNTEDLKSIIFSHNADNVIPHPSPANIGRHVGSWLRSFHTWSSAPEQAAIQVEIGQNVPMRKLKRMITYDSFLKILENYPELVECCRETLENVRDVMSKEFEKPPTDKDENWGIIHGDFWAGNVLLPTTPWQEPQQPGRTNKLFIIDWELAQYGHRAYDLGQMVGDLYERNNIDTVMPIMEGVIEGYGKLSDDMAFRTAIHAGVHLIGWYIRRDPTAPLPAPLDVVMAALTIGRDFILKGWEKDREFFEGSVLSPLFAAN